MILMIFFSKLGFYIPFSILSNWLLVQPTGAYWGLPIRIIFRSFKVILVL